MVIGPTSASDTALPKTFSPHFDGQTIRRIYNQPRWFSHRGRVSCGSAQIANLWRLAANMIPLENADGGTVHPAIGLVRKIARWDAIVVTLLLALAAYLYSERPIHPIVASAPPQIDPVEIVGKFVRGNGPNLVQNATNFSAKSWVLEGITVTANAGSAPDGTKTAARLAETRGGERHRILALVDGLTPGDPYTLSAFVKPKERSAFAFEMLDVPLVHYGIIQYDLAQKRVAHLGGDISGAGIQELSDGWFRLWAVMPYQSAKMGFSVSLLTDSAMTVIYNGAEGDGALIWGVQFEPGATLHNFSPPAAQQ